MSHPQRMFVSVGCDEGDRLDVDLAALGAWVLQRERKAEGGKSVFRIGWYLLRRE